MPAWGLHKQRFDISKWYSAVLRHYFIFFFLFFFPWCWQINSHVKDRHNGGAWSGVDAPGEAVSGFRWYLNHSPPLSSALWRSAHPALQRDSPTPPAARADHPNLKRTSTGKIIKLESTSRCFFAFLFPGVSLCTSGRLVYTPRLCLWSSVISNCVFYMSFIKLTSSRMFARVWSMCGDFSATFWHEIWFLVYVCIIISWLCVFDIIISHSCHMWTPPSYRWFEISLWYCILNYTERS